MEPSGRADRAPACRAARAADRARRALRRAVRALAAGRARPDRDARRPPSYYEELVPLAGDPKLAANWVMGELAAYLNEHALEIERVAGEAGGARGPDRARRRRARSARPVPSRCSRRSRPARAGETRARSCASAASSRSPTGRAAGRRRRASSPRTRRQAAEYRAGKQALIGFFVGQIMRKTGGRAEPRAVQELLREELGSAAYGWPAPAPPVSEEPPRDGTSDADPADARPDADPARGAGGDGGADAPPPHRASSRAIYGAVLEKLRRVYRTEHDVLMFTSSGTGAFESAYANLLVARRPRAVRLGRQLRRSLDRDGEGLRRGGAEAARAGSRATGRRPGGRRDRGRSRPRARRRRAQRDVDGRRSPTSRRSPSARAGATRCSSIDAVSSLGAAPLETDAWGLDVVVTGSQKAFMCPPGLAFASVSPRAWERVERATRAALLLRLEAHAQGAGRRAAEPVHARRSRSCWGSTPRST